MFAGNILIIIRRSNGDVLLSASLIAQLEERLKPDAIDLLINEDTITIAKTLPFVRRVITFSYQKRQKNRWKQEKNIIKEIYRKYDLSINLTANDGSVLYALLASKYAISAVENNLKQSWWKRLLLKGSYHFDSNKHILLNNLEPLNCLGLNHSKIQLVPTASDVASASILSRLAKLDISKFIIFHPCAQYEYKVYPENLRGELLTLLNQLNTPIIVTGGNSDIDLSIKKTLPKLNNIYDWIGKTSIEECIALSKLSLGYIGMDTLNMHISAGQNKRIFAIFGPTKLSMWSPWSNELQISSHKNNPLQNYGNVTIFQADMPCVACSHSGCEGSGVSKCLYNISPKLIFNEIKNWHQKKFGL
jgi:heptosyltransferase-3